MKTFRISSAPILFSIIALASCTSASRNDKPKDSVTLKTASSGSMALPEPDTTASHTNFSNVIGWKDGQTPVAPAGFKVTAFASGLKSPRNIYIAPNGDILVALANSERKGMQKVAGILTGKSKSESAGSSANTILLLRDADADGVPEVKQTFLSGLNQPFGMLILKNSFYVANTDGVISYPYVAGQLKMDAQGKKIADLPAGGYNNHWTRNLLGSADGSKIYVSVGSGSNVAEHGIENEKRRANILEMNPDGSGETIYASGLRNPVGLALAPGSKTLWAAVNERDELGDDLVPDYVTSVKKGAFYGWPYAYFGQHPDPRMHGDRPDLVKQAIVPDVSLGAHTASLGLAFYTGNRFPGKYRNGAFIGQHGSWNRAQLAGYKVVFIPFADGKPAGKPADFLTGFIADAAKSKVFGRPVGVAVARDGALLVADDVSGVIWRVVPE